MKLCFLLGMIQSCSRLRRTLQQRRCCFNLSPVVRSKAVSRLPMYSAHISNRAAHADDFRAKLIILYHYEAFLIDGDFVSLGKLL